MRAWAQCTRKRRAPARACWSLVQVEGVAVLGALDARDTLGGQALGELPPVLLVAVHQEDPPRPRLEGLDEGQQVVLVGMGRERVHRLHPGGDLVLEAEYADLLGPVEQPPAERALG